MKNKALKINLCLAYRKIVAFILLYLFVVNFWYIVLMDSDHT